MFLDISILILFLILSAFFSATEVAYISLTDAKVEAMIKRKLPRSRKIKKLKEKPRRLLATILIGNNIVNIAASSYATVIMGKIFDSAVIGITTGIMTLLVLVFGEIIPKSHANTHKKQFAIFAVPFLQSFQFIIYPFVLILEWITNITAGKDTPDTISEEELRAMAQTGLQQGSIEQNEGVMIERLFKFNDITAEDIMTPRVLMAFIRETHTIAEAAKIIEEKPHTRFPVIGETPDIVVGFVHARDVLLAFHKDQETAVVKAIARPIITIPGQMPIDDVMREFQKHRTHMGIVVDEFGGTEGIITFKDVIEELVGEITDEHQIDEELIKRIDKNTILVAGDTDIRDINDFLNVHIPGDALDTIAEIILDTLQKFPRKGAKIPLGDVVCTVEEIRKRRINRVNIRKA
ncbi:hemolysin family protein [Patescibacteria group bacterium]|nr:hemolysin family protein [Patescibacteria group bacterium]MBU1721333.1 hemolysin family protein [Patescibacteria group bacterium]MBU1901618.1 hemolysin family protein [Patescibacteria group bacterium]